MLLFRSYSIYAFQLFQYLFTIYTVCTSSWYHFETFSLFYPGGFFVVVIRTQESLCIRYSLTQLNMRSLPLAVEITGVGKTIATVLYNSRFLCLDNLIQTRGKVERVIKSVRSRNRRWVHQSKVTIVNSSRFTMAEYTEGFFLVFFFQSALWVTYRGVCVQFYNWYIFTSVTYFEMCFTYV